MRDAKRDRGFVLVNALIVVAAVSALAIGVLRDAEAGIERVSALRSSDRAALALDGAALLVRLRLEADDPAVDGPGDAWVSEAESWSLDAARVTLDSSDLQGRFNLNWLLRPDLPGIDDAFLALAGVAGVPGDASAAIVARYAALSSTADPAEPPEGSDFARDEIALAAELLALEGVDRAALEALEPLLAFLPAGSGLNLNTAGREVILALTGGSETAFSAFAAAREQPFDDPADAVTALEQAQGGPAPLVTLLAEVATSWVELRATALVEGERSAATFVLRRDSDTSTAAIIFEVPRDA